MKTLNLFSSAMVFLVFLFIGCSNSETGKTTTESTTEEQIDTLQSADEKAAKIDREKDDEKPVKKETKNQVIVRKKTTENSVQKPSENPDNISKETTKIDSELTEEPKPKKADNYSFIIANEGKQVADDFKGDLMTTATEEVYIEKKGKCGNEDCGKKIILVNMNQDKSIEITIRINWKENDKKISKKRSYKLNESQKLEIGCSSKCDENKTPVKWQIIGAIYAE